jgi:hypothetical protein
VVAVLFRGFAFVPILLLAVSCADPVLHLGDRHGLSYAPVASYALKHPGTTLVLWDYHHDSGPSRGFDGPNAVPTSVDWVGTLVDRHLVDRVLWVSGRTLLLPNQRARQAWLIRKTAVLAPDRQKYLLGHIELVDSADLRRRVLPGPVAVTLDMDILTKDPGPDAAAFLDEIAAWIRLQRPEVVTVALSAAYQPSPAKAWSWLSRLSSTWPKGERRWILDLAPLDDQPESNEEIQAWRQWAGKPDGWRPAMGSFRPGIGVWLGAPQSVRTALLGQGITAGSPQAQDVLDAWADKDDQALEASADAARLGSYAQAGLEGLNAFWKGKIPAAPEGGGSGGLAMRLHIQGRDRGCLALWSGLADFEAGARYATALAARDPRYPEVRPDEAEQLTLQPSLFGPWRPMPDAMGFISGFHSVMVVDGTKHTLIQAPLALERGWDRRAFLEALAEKAGLGRDGWHKPGLLWYRAATVWGELPVTKPR